MRSMYLLLYYSSLSPHPETECQLHEGQDCISFTFVCSTEYGTSICFLNERLYEWYEIKSQVNDQPGRGEIQAQTNAFSNLCRPCPPHHSTWVPVQCKLPQYSLTVDIQRCILTKSQTHTQPDTQMHRLTHRQAQSTHTHTYTDGGHFNIYAASAHLQIPLLTEKCILTHTDGVIHSHGSCLPHTHTCRRTERPTQACFCAHTKTTLSQASHGQAHSHDTLPHTYTQAQSHTPSLPRTQTDALPRVHRHSGRHARTHSKTHPHTGMLSHMLPGHSWSALWLQL